MSLRTLPLVIASGLVALTLPVALGAAEAQPQSAVVTITVANVQAETGFILAALHDESGWGGPRAAVARAPAQAGTVLLRLVAPAPGRYGVRLFHDVDGDGQLNANMLGIPTEPFGFSNNAPLQFGPPSFSAAAFDIPASGASQTIALR